MLAAARFKNTQHCGVKRWALLAAALASCRGGDSSPGALPPSSTYAARCAVPRAGIDPLTGRPFPDAPGAVGDEKTWLRSWIDELYLWYREVPNPDPAGYATPAGYFDALKTPARTASGKPKDQFHSTFPTAAWEALSQAGVQAGYGVQWVVLSNSPPRLVVAAYTEPGAPAARQNIGRGAQVLAVDGVDVVNGANTDALNAGLFPSAANEPHTFSILDPGAVSARSVTMTSADVESAPVPSVKTLTVATDTIGYVLFNDHVATAEDALGAAVDQLKTAGVKDLVLDIRYNGGGYLDIASELAYMIAGPAATKGRTFERSVFNDKYQATNPVIGGALTPLPFHATTGFTTIGQPLPYLGLSRVFVLTGRGTCSASESIMNGLRGVDVEVIQIGSTTCGKPYGFYPQDNCGTTYFSIQFQGVNDKGFGDYPDGFTPGGTGPAALPGCQVADDFTHALGDPAEARLAAALAYRSGQTCPPATFPLTLDGATPYLSATEGEVIKSPWHQNRIFRK